MMNYVLSFVYLNNVGISLLERQRYQESMEIFQDAINVYRYYYNSLSIGEDHRCERTCLSNTSSINTNNINEMIKEKLMKAAKKLSNSNYEHNIILKMNYHTEILDPMITLDINNDDEYFASLNKYGSAIDQIDFVIRMMIDNDNNTPSLESRDNNKCWKLYYPILIFNYGVACKRSSEVSDKFGFSEEHQTLLRMQSNQLFHFTHSIIMVELQSCNMLSIHSNNHDNVRNLLHTLSILMFTSAHIRDMMHWSHTMEDGMKYYVIFEKSFQFFHQLLQEYKTGPFSMTTKHAAVA